jgi:hypothetical protein
MFSILQLRQFQAKAKAFVYGLVFYSGSVADGFSHREP